MPRKCRVSFVIGEHDVPSFIQQLSRYSLAFNVSYVEEPKTAYPPLPKANGEVHIQKVAPGKVWSRRAADVSTTPAGRAVLECFERNSIVHFVDAQHAIKEIGYSNGMATKTLELLIGKGLVVKMRRGQYRKPSDQESLDLISKRKIELGVT